MKYVKPADVNSPKDHIKEVTVLYDGGKDSISVAKIKWGNEELWGARWNVSMREMKDKEKIKGKECVGMPTSRGFPVWFIIPDDFMDKDSDLWNKIDQARKEVL